MQSDGNGGSENGGGPINMPAINIPIEREPKAPKEPKSPQGSGGKPGKGTVSQKAKDTVVDIKKANSVGGKGSIATEVQRVEILRQLENERIQAAADGRMADAKYFEKERDKVKKMRLGANSISTTPARRQTVNVRPGRDGSRNDGGTH